MVVCGSVFSINVCAGIAGDCLVGPHVLPHRLTGNHYREFLLYDLPKLLEYVLLTDHECGICMMILRHILKSLDFYLWEHLTTPVYVAPVDNQEALHHRIVDVCQTIRNYPDIFERMLPSMMRCVEVCIESRGEHFEHVL
jgi:hypothetical protein